MLWYWLSVLGRAADESLVVIFAQPAWSVAVSVLTWGASLAIAYWLWGRDVMRGAGRWGLAVVAGTVAVGLLLFGLNLIRAPHLLAEDQGLSVRLKDGQIETLQKQIKAKDEELARNPVRPDLRGEIDFILIVQHQNWRDITGIIITGNVTNLGTPTVVTGFGLNLTLPGSAHAVEASSHEIEGVMSFRNAFGAETVYLYERDALYNKHAERALERGGRAPGRLLFGVRGITANELGRAVGTKYQLRFRDVEGRRYSVTHVWQFQPAPPTLPNYPGLTPLLKLPRR